jgi:hypothetical protein
MLAQCIAQCISRSVFKNAGTTNGHKVRSPAVETLASVPAIAQVSPTRLTVVLLPSRNAQAFAL